MDFTTALPDPLDFTSGPKNYPSMTIDSFSIGDTTYWTAHGEVEIGGIPRFTKGSIENGVFTSLEISTLHSDDTFSFKVPGQKYGLGYTLASIIMWWDRRVKEGVLKETENGFILDENYIDQVFARLRERQQVGS